MFKTAIPSVRAQGIRDLVVQELIQVESSRDPLTAVSLDHP